MHRKIYLRSLHWLPEYEVMEQSQVKPSHCWLQMPWFAQESSWQVVLGPGERMKRREWNKAERITLDRPTKASINHYHLLSGSSCRREKSLTIPGCAKNLGKNLSTKTSVHLTTKQQTVTQSKKERTATYSLLGRPNSYVPNLLKEFYSKIGSDARPITTARVLCFPRNLTPVEKWELINRSTNNASSYPKNPDNLDSNWSFEASAGYNLAL